MLDRYYRSIGSELQLKEHQVKAVSDLIAEGSTVPFIARYRKEATGALDEVHIIAIRDRLEQLRELDKRREAILKSLKEQEKLTEELERKVRDADTLSKLEDIYLPYRPKRRTRGMIAREKGLEPLAATIFEQKDMDVHKGAETFVDAEKGIETPDDALAGARDIIAEWINEDESVRARLRELFLRKAVLRSGVSRGKEETGIKYKDYYDWTEPVATAPSHRILAIRRGASEGFLTFHILPDETITLSILRKRFIKADNAAAEQVSMALHDSYKRLLSLSMETEMRVHSKKIADEAAIKVFAENLRDLLLAPPMGRKHVMAVDPGMRTGCKIVCLDGQGKLLATDAIFPLEPFKRTTDSEKTVRALCSRYGIEAIAVGNGTGGREAEDFLKTVDFGKHIPIIMVSESGASVYSASETAREEFPDEDITVRGSVSIGRRLMDPLAELVKIDPKSIGVGQYQHDVDQGKLKSALDDVVVSCVNAVGVDVNTASKELLRYVSGLSERLAGNIVSFRNEHGAFETRNTLLKVTGMGSKTFEQSAGFLRIHGGRNPLDASAVHPESYPIVESMARDRGVAVTDLMADATLRKGIRLEDYVTEVVGIPTLHDIMNELAKPGRDPRREFELFKFTEGITEMTDLEVGMKLSGVVTNVAAFGAFVDIGVHQDGLVHISHLADRFVRNPHDIVKVHQKVTVTVIDIDLARKRISLSMKKMPCATPQKNNITDRRIKKNPNTIKKG
jgi:uncharacterized protein